MSSIRSLAIEAMRDEIVGSAAEVWPTRWKNTINIRGNVDLELVFLAVIRVIRTPTREMLIEGSNPYADQGDVWEAMIDAILNEPTSEQSP